MAAGCFLFDRGIPVGMAVDLGVLTPHSGLEFQLYGDAHAGNFGYGASTERPARFDLNDFAKTLRRPVESDRERLSTSLLIAAALAPGRSIAPQRSV